MNIQENIIRGILELLYQQDYLVLPGFGGFVLKSQASTFSVTGTALLPPSKKLGFNKQLRQNDGVLLNWLQNELNCDALTAQTHLEEFADFCNSILNTKRRLTIERLGFFYLDFENNLCFEPRSDINFLKESFGLGPVHLTEIEVEQPKSSPELKSKVFIDRPSAIPARSPELEPKRMGSGRLKRGLAYSAMISFVIIAIGFVITTVRIQGPLKAAMYGSSLKAEYSQLTYPALELVEPSSHGPAMIHTSVNESLLKLDENIAFVVNSAPLSSNKPVSRHKVERASGRYNIVFGCFSVKANAIKYAKNLESKDYRVSVSQLEGKNMYQVAMVGFQSREAAKAELNSIQTLFPNVWIKALP